MEMMSTSQAVKSSLVAQGAAADGVHDDFIVK